MLRTYGGLLLVGFILALEIIPQPLDKVAVLDVGQGDAILLQSGTAQVLTDGTQNYLLYRWKSLSPCL